MALKKTNYVNGKTVISAENLNDIQDAVLDLESKDGVGMGITGATVGQIAKVAAVDASGVPTAWSPVDMQGGVLYKCTRDTGNPVYHDLSALVGIYVELVGNTG